MSKKFIWLSTFLLAFIFGQTSFADSSISTNQTDSSAYQSHKGFDKMATELNLTDDQKVKIQAMKQQAHSNLKANFTQLKALRGQISALISSDKMDETKLDNLISQRSAIKNTMLKNRIMMQHQIYILLNDKQKVQYLDLKKKWEAKHSQ